MRKPAPRYHHRPRPPPPRPPSPLLLLLPQLLLQPPAPPLLRWQRRRPVASSASGAPSPPPSSPSPLPGASGFRAELRRHLAARDLPGGRSGWLPEEEEARQFLRESLKRSTRRQHLADAGVLGDILKLSRRVNEPGVAFAWLRSQDERAQLENDPHDVKWVLTAKGEVGGDEKHSLKQAEAAVWKHSACARHARRHPEVWTLGEILATTFLPRHDRFEAMLTALGDWAEHGSGLGCLLDKCEGHSLRQGRIPPRAAVGLLLVWGVLSPPQNATRIRLGFAPAIADRPPSLLHDNDKDSSGIQAYEQMISELFGELGPAWSVRCVAAYLEAGFSTQSVQSDMPKALVLSLKESEESWTEESESGYYGGITEATKRDEAANSLTKHELGLRAERLKRSKRRNQRARATPTKIERRVVLAVDRHSCVYCRSKGSQNIADAKHLNLEKMGDHSLPGLTLDHVIPIKTGGGRGREPTDNLLACCLSCNGHKGHKALSRWVPYWINESVPRL